MTAFGTRLLNGRRSRWLAALALALIATRALVPAGFMLASDDGGVELRFCGGTAHVGGHSPGHALADASCPFALSAGPAPPPALARAPADAAQGPAWLAPAESQLHPGLGPPRQPAARGPPLAT